MSVNRTGHAPCQPVRSSVHPGCWRICTRTAAGVDWAAIRDLYSQLLKIHGENSGVQLNMAIAVAEAGDMATALDLLDTLEPTAVAESRPARAAKAHVHQIATDSQAAHHQRQLAAQTAPPTLRTQPQLARIVSQLCEARPGPDQQ